MIKYFDFDSTDQYGQHIVPINTERDINLTKTAASNWDPTLTGVIANLKRDPKYYYVVINALGSFEVWGANRNGDGFPEVGLKHKSLRSDMGTPDDYGYKTFIYYAKLFKHHVNKDPKKSFGNVLYSHWNDSLKRVELIVAINRDIGSDMVEALEGNDLVSVSMGCKVRYDSCSVCGNKAKTTRQYCKHLKQYMGKVIGGDIAEQWSKELKKTILPGTVVYAVNDFPRFFDISKVYVGADRTAYVLGKAASTNHVIPSAYAAEAYGVTDETIDKLAVLGKVGVIKKTIQGGADGIVARPNVMKDKIDGLVSKSIESEPEVPNSALDAISSSMPVKDVLATMLGLGIHPKPREFQRIILVSSGAPRLANYLDDNHMCFDHNEPVDPIDFDMPEHHFNDVIARALMPYLEQRSAFPYFLEKRLDGLLEKKGASIGDNYWLESGPNTGSYIETSPLSPQVKALGGLAAIYAGLKLKASGFTPRKIIDAFQTKPWLRSLIVGGTLLALMNKVVTSRDENDPLLLPASQYGNVLQNTNFSGHMKYSSTEGSILLPNAYIMNSYNQKSLYKKGSHIFSNVSNNNSVAISNLEPINIIASRINNIVT